MAEKIAAKQQLTNIPTIYLTVPDAIGKDINSVLFKTGNVAEYHAATIEVVDNTGAISFTEDKLEIKVRGNETAKGDKKPYRLKFGKDEKDAAGNVTKSHKHDMLGSGYAKRNWVLLANQKDGTLLHNALAYHIGQAVGMEFCPGYKFADLVINGQYRGSYQISDHVEVGSHRIDVDEDTGMYLESTRGDMVEEPGVSAGALGISIKNPEYTETADIESLKAKVTNIFTKANTYMGVYGTPCDDELFCNPKTGWRSIFDEETLVKYYIGVNITGNHDGFMTVKMYCNEGEKLHFGPLWDFDTSYGQYDDGKTLCEDTQLGAPLFTNYANTIVKKDPVFVKKVHDKLHALIDEGLETKLLTAINTMANEVEPSYHLNRTIWTNNGADYSGQTSELKQYVSTHLSWLTETIDEKYEAMGGDNIVIPEIPDDEDDPEVGPALNTEYTVPDMGFNGGYNNYPIPASAFNSKATSALITVSGAVYIKFIYRLNQWGYSQDALAEFPNKGNVPQTGTYLVEGDMLQRALRGELAVNCDGNSNIVVTVFNNGSEEPATPDTPAPTRAQLTNLPTIYLDATTINGEWQQAAVEVFDKDNKLYQGETWKKEGLSKKGNINVSVQYQGSGAAGSKNSYRLKFNDKINLLTADDSYKQWVLLANDDDPSMLNNALAKELGDAIGMPWTPGYQFVDLYVNNTYMGTYQVTDRIKVESGRSLVTGGNKDNDWQLRFNDASELKEDGTEHYVATISNAPYVILRNPDPKDITPEQLTTLKNNISQYFTNFFGKNYANVEANVDKDQLINWYICQEILGVYKGFSSIEAYRSITSTAADNKVHFGPLWDSEKGFGNTGSAPSIDMSDLNTNGSHNGLMVEYAAYDGMKQFFQFLWTQDWFKSGVKTKWGELYTGSTTSGLAQTLKTKASSLAETLEQSQAKDLVAWPNSMEYNSTSHAKHANYAAAVAAISTYIDQRFPYLDKKFKELAEGAKDEEVTVTTLVEAIKQLMSGRLTKQEVDKIVEELLNKE